MVCETSSNQSSDETVDWHCRMYDFAVRTRLTTSSVNNAGRRSSVSTSGRLRTAERRLKLLRTRLMRATVNNACGKDSQWTVERLSVPFKQ